MLSQVIKNIETYARKVAPIQNLPAEANTALQKMASLVNSDLKQIEVIRTEVLGFATEGLDTINIVKSSLQAGGTQVSSPLNDFKKNAKVAQTATENGANLASSLRSSISETLQTLSGVDQKLRDEMIALKSKEANDTAKVNALQRKMKLLPLLILAGLAGAIALGIEMSKAKNELASTMSEVIQYTVQLAELRTTHDFLTEMFQQVMTLMIKVQGLKNALDEVSGDLANALNDEHLAQKLEAFLFLTATETELHEIQSDVA